MGRNIINFLFKKKKEIKKIFLRLKKKKFLKLYLERFKNFIIFVPALAPQSDRCLRILGYLNHTSLQSASSQIWMINSSGWIWCKINTLHTYRPPRKCLPLNHLVNGLGAVKLIRASGWKSLPGPDSGGPFSMSQDDGASTEVTGKLVSLNALMTAGNGSLTSPEKLNPSEVLV